MKAIVAMMILAMAAGLWGCDRDAQGEKPIDAPGFVATDQNGNAVSRQDMLGKVWLTHFIFTRCHGPCPMMTAKMKQIQEALGDAPVTLVSFTVDPAYDSPAILKQYMKDRSASEGNWLMLNTGSEHSVQTLARAMHIGVAKAGEEIIHGTHFILVDKEGKIRGYYSGTDEVGWKNAVSEAKKLAK
jgi:protein SCO1/2